MKEGIAVLLALLVMGGILLLAVEPATAGGPYQYHPTHYANFTGDVSNTPGVADVQRDGQYVHPDVNTSSFELMLGEVFGDYAGLHAGYFSLSLRGVDSFHYGWRGEDDTSYSLDGYGVYTYDRRADTFTWVSEGPYTIEWTGCDETACGWHTVWEGTPAFTITGVPLP